MLQFDLPARAPMVPVDPDLIARQPSLTRALVLCQTLSGHEDKRFVGSHGVCQSAAQFSRIMVNGQHHFPQDKLNLFMDLAGNEAPLMWLAYSRGYDLTTMRLRESETQRELRETREALAAERGRNKVLVDALHGRVSA